MKTEQYQPLFDHMSENHDLSLFHSELDDIIDLVHEYYPKWYGPEVVPSMDYTGEESNTVEDTNGSQYFFDYVEMEWYKVDMGQKIKSIPTQWRYPEPKKLEQ